MSPQASCDPTDFLLLKGGEMMRSVIQMENVGNDFRSHGTAAGDYRDS